MTTPSVTVLMPVHNGGQYLVPAIESVIAQSFTDFEFLILDDGSTDETPARLADFARADSRVRVVTNSNQGLIKTLNDGLTLAKGKYIARMDADDISHASRLEKQFAYLEQNPKVSLLGTACRYLTDEGPTNVVLRFERSPARIRRRIVSVNQFCHPTVMFRTDAVREIGGYHSSFVHAEDCDLWLRIVERHEAANLDDILLDYRLHCGQVSLRHLRQQSMSALAARTLARRRRRGRAASLRDGQPIRAEILLRHGVSQLAINRNIIDHHIRWLGTLQRVGFDAAASDLLAVIRQIGNELDLASYADARLRLEEGLSRAVAGQLMRGLTSAAKACFMQPRLTAYLLDLVASRFARYGLSR